MKDHSPTLDAIEHVTYDALETAYNRPGVHPRLPRALLSQIAASAAHAARKRARELIKNRAELDAEADQRAWEKEQDDRWYVTDREACS